jgi:hypothetical protein
MRFGAGDVGIEILQPKGQLIGIEALDLVIAGLHGGGHVRRQHL